MFFCGQVSPKGKSKSHYIEFPGNLTVTQDDYTASLAGDTPVMRIDIPHAQGVNAYGFAGQTMLDAVAKYNMFCGGGAELPEWALGTWYRMYVSSTAKDWVQTARKFTAQNLAISVLGLEPGWQTHTYAYTHVWDDKRLGNHQNALDTLQALGYHVNLWEHCFTHPESPIYDALLPVSGDTEVWGGLVPDFALPKAREVFIRQQKRLGVSIFKLDECDGSDFTGGWSFPDSTSFPSGLDGEQMHHMLGLLYQQTINAAFPGSCHNVRASGAMASPYPFILYSDLYDHGD